MRSSVVLFSLLPALSGAMASVCKPSSSVAAIGAVDLADPNTSASGASNAGASGSPTLAAGVSNNTLPAGVSDTPPASGQASGTASSAVGAVDTASAVGAAGAGVTAAAGAAGELPAGGSVPAAETTVSLESGDYVKIMANATVDSGVPAATFAVTDSGKDCECGYNVASLESAGHTYFRKRFSFDFSTLPDGSFSSTDDLLDQGWRIRGPEAHVGGPYTDTATGVTSQCLGDPTKLSIQDGALQLTVTGNQAVSPNMSCPEIIFDTPVLHGVFQASIQMTDTPGTCEAFWLNHTSTTTCDELDIEVIGGAIFKANAQGTGPGLWSTSWQSDWDPAYPDTIPHTHGLQPFPADSDPTAGFNNYTMVWLPDSQQRYYNGAAMASAIHYNGITPMNPSINNWSNGAPGWSAGPPLEDSVMKVQNVLFYYNTETDKDLPANCKEADICTV